jgi:hypothetical protein
MIEPRDIDIRNAFRVALLGALKQTAPIGSKSGVRFNAVADALVVVLAEVLSVLPAPDVERLTAVFRAKLVAALSERSARSASAPAQAPAAIAALDDRPHSAASAIGASKPAAVPDGRVTAGDMGRHERRGSAVLALIADAIGRSAAAVGAKLSCEDITDQIEIRRNRLAAALRALTALK